MISYKPENMVVLRYARNTEYVEVVPLESALGIKRLKVDLEKGTWSCDVATGEDTQEHVSRAIAQPIIPHRVGLRQSGAPIGVYDRMDNDHMNHMASACINAIRP